MQFSVNGRSGNYSEICSCGAKWDKLHQMAASPYRVYVIVDRQFGEGLNELERGVPVWIVDSPDNMPVVRRLWQSRPDESYLNGITSFVDSKSSSPEGLFLKELYMIDLHHGIHSADPPYTVLEVIGVDVTPKIREELATYGFDEFQNNIRGFVATRPESAADGS
jgi:hypothetical protein